MLSRLVRGIVVLATTCTFAFCEVSVESSDVAQTATAVAAQK